MITPLDKWMILEVTTSLLILMLIAINNYLLKEKRSNRCRQIPFSYLVRKTNRNKRLMDSAIRSQILHPKLYRQYSILCLYLSTTSLGKSVDL